MSDQGEAERAQSEMELQARVNKLVNNLPSGYGSPERVYHAACEVAEHYGYTGAARQRFADTAKARWRARVGREECQAEQEIFQALGGCSLSRQEASATSVAPSPIYHQGERVTVWIAGLSPCNAIIRRPDRIREGEWWYLCSMSGMFGAEHLAPMPENWIRRPGEDAPRTRNLASNDDQALN
jgi:hypothetical protein